MVHLPGTMTATQLAERVRWAHHLNAGLATLEPEQRTVLKLSYFDSMTQATIADRLGLPISQIRGSAAKGLTLLALFLVPSPGSSGLSGARETPVVS
jgi:DNA-directed RNA polymerase specialized sigma24 family protein